ncbi:MAG TPA: hypothetical protein VGF50_13110 [Caulobacteraceae bacterium]
MKVYDIALMLIRAVIALDLIREVVSLAYDVVRGALVVAAAGDTSYMKVVEGTTAVSPIIGIVVSILILANSKRIARFAAKFATPLDAAAEFH